MKQTHALLACLISSASPTLADKYPMSYGELLAREDISFTASEVLEDYRIWCEESEDLRGYRPNTDYDPVFMMGEGSYRKVQLTNDGVEAELIQQGYMMCGDLHLTVCGSGGCFSEIIFDGLVYNIRGRPFLLFPEPSYEGLGDNNKMTAIIAWWGHGGSCHTQEDEETDPLHTLKPSSCLLTAQYDSRSGRLVFQHDYRLWPER